MTIAEAIVGFGTGIFGLVGLALMLIAALVALFKIDEADRYFGAWESPEQLYLKGLPFSLSRMTCYGLTILFKGRRVIRQFNPQGKEHLIDQAPVRLKRLLVWLYTSWILCFVFAIAIGSAGMLFGVW